MSWKQIHVTICLNYTATHTEQFNKSSIKQNKLSNNKMELKWRHEGQNERIYTKKIKKKMNTINGQLIYVGGNFPKGS